MKIEIESLKKTEEREMEEDKPQWLGGYGDRAAENSVVRSIPSSIHMGDGMQKIQKEINRRVL